MRLASAIIWIRSSDSWWVTVGWRVPEWGMEDTVHTHYQVLGGGRVVVAEDFAERVELVGLFRGCIGAYQ